ncbi:MAG TPA: hypothetical protein VMT46_11265 [Anaerolineaceae bacterium]|nr:hypothetical protein [Anaerolineaceae bacterium]
MEELIQKIAEKVGITQEQARKAVLIATDYVKSKIPEAMYEDIDALLETPSVSEEEARELGLFRFP